MKDTVTPRLQRYVERLASGMPSRAAAKSAGYSESFSRVAAYRLGKKPVVVQALAAIRMEGRKMAVYDLATAMQEADDVCAFAKLHKNAMAYCKATELRAKLSGLLIERVEIATVDLSAALQRAEERVNKGHSTSLPGNGSVAIGAPADLPYYHGPGKGGDPFAE